MAFDDFTLRTAVVQFGLTKERDIDLFAAAEPLPPSDSLRAWLDEFAPVALGVNSEKARSEFIIAPILAEAKRRVAGGFNVLPGVTLDVDRERGLFGFCDFLVAGSDEFYYLRGPILAVVEAKREDIVAGLGQCAAEMVALRLFNEREGTPRPAVFGCVTSGSIWRFLKLQTEVLSIDRAEYYLRDVAKLLGIFMTIARGE